MTELEDQKKFAEQMLGATFEFAKLAISSLILLNAGAATALLAFIGGHGATVAAMYALFSFALGAGLGGIGSVSAYFGQRQDWEVATGRGESRLASNLLVGFAAMCVLGGYVLFFLGCMKSASGIPQPKIDAPVVVQTVQPAGSVVSPMVVDTALYYTYSTIAQSLAAAMALLAAFAVYRLGAINSECSISATAMEAETGGGIKIRVLANASDWSGVRTEIEGRVGVHGYQHLSDEMKSRLTRIDRLRSTHRRILIALRVSLGLTALTVAASIVVLAYVPAIQASGWALGVLNGGIGISVLSLLTYLWLVMKAFRT